LQTQLLFLKWPEFPGFLAILREGFRA